MKDIRSGIRTFMTNAELHIYIKKDKLTPAIATEWMSTLKRLHPEIKFEIKTIEEFLK